eukprot:scaffold10501_cov141-Amphora_coffeaeformis.AAC.2
MKLFAIWALPLFLPSTSAAVRRGCQVTLMTRNLYHGGNNEEIVAATDVSFLEKFAEFIYQAMGSQFDYRMSSVADEIANAQPDFVGLQEANVWTFTFDDGEGGDSILEYNFLDIILSHLQAVYGLTYNVAVVADPPAFDQTTPPDWPLHDLMESLKSIRWLYRDVLLVRQGVPYWNPHSEPYSNYVTYQFPIIGAIPDQRSWLSVDSRVGGQLVRVVTTHLESEDRPIRALQAEELASRDGPLASQPAVFVMGDLNSKVDPSDDMDGVEIIMEYGELSSAWLDYCNVDCDVPTWFDDFDLVRDMGDNAAKIDYILYSGDVFDVLDVALVDSELNPQNDLGVDRPTRPSDHAGVVATFVLDKCGHNGVRRRRHRGSSSSGRI